MELGQRISKGPVRFVEDPKFGSQDKPDKPANKRQPRKQPKKLVEKLQSRTKTTTNTTNAPAKTLRQREEYSI
jgi:hypothetical protein